jgi:hypothetical protein
MKVIFLDIDGVLNCKKTPNPRKFPYVVDKRLLVRFKRLLEKTGAKVVLSSTWRYDPAGLFSAKHWSIPFIDITPDMPKRPRRDEILAWLKKHPRVTRFVVIDDEDDELDQLPLFQPSATAPHILVSLTIEVLGRPPVPGHIGQRVSDARRLLFSIPLNQQAIAALTRK